LASKRLNIAIAGAGPGGLAAALALQRQGHKVVVYEQFEKPKPIGSGLILQPTGLGVLDWLGLGDRMRGLGARIDRLAGTASRTGKVVLDVRYEALGPSRGYAVHRTALFNVLFEAVQAANIPLETSRQIKGLEDGVLLLGEGRKSPRHDLVIDALGARSPLKSFTVQGVREKQLEYGAIWASLPWPGPGFDPHALAQRYDRASVMVGVLPIGRMHEAEKQQAAFFWSLKIKDYESWRTRGLDAWKDDVLRHWPETAPMLQHIQHTDDLVLARYQHHTLRTPYANRLICIGDSAHSTSPQLGQGANMALLDVMALCAALSRNTDVSLATEDYARQRKRHVLVYQTLSMMFTPFYQSDSRIFPWLRDTLVATSSRLPMVQRLLASIVAGTLVAPIRADL
jgi:2-polyprenyl-6-methoxyphenol hydroxylase-like FAD-dependent oxidoreductase